jgi:hypothetical protein
MSKASQEWLANRASPPGMLACGMRGPDGKCVSHSLEEICPKGTLERILGQFDELRAALFSDQLSPAWTTWAFDQGHIRFVARPDGWLLGLCIRPDSEAQLRLDPLSREFLALDLSG